jgi:valyl-tRNA synthetase
VVVAPWPAADPARRDEAAEAEVRAVQDVITEVRRFRSDQGVRPGQRVPARLAGLAEPGLAGQESTIRTLARLDPAEAGFTATASLSVRGVTIEVDLSGAIDVPAERARLAKDLAAAEKDASVAQAKLGNPDFVAKAPAPVVAKMEARLADARAEIARLAAQLAALPPV